MNVKLKYLDRTCLQEDAFIKLVRKYGSKLTHDVLIIFDLRIKDFGLYMFDGKKKIHTIQISPTRCNLSFEGTKLDPAATKYHLISTAIHELFHAQQYENMRGSFWSKKYRCADEISNAGVAEFFSVCEVEARTHENQNILQAVEYYTSCAEQ